MFAKSLVPVTDVVEELQSVSLHVGLTPEDVVSLLESGLTVNDLLDYVEAVVFERIH